MTSTEERRRRAVLFDLGGTLLVMRRDRVLQRVLQESGRASSLEEVHKAYVSVEPAWLSRYGNRELTASETEAAYRVKDTMAFQHLFPGEPDARAIELSELARTFWKDADRKVPYELYPDAVPALEELRGRDFALALVSNAPAGTEDVVRRLGLHELMDAVVISGVVGYSKPHPEIFRIALEKLGSLPSHATHVGDVYESDVVGARNAGIRGVLLSRDGTVRNDCDVIQNLAALSPFLP